MIKIKHSDLSEICKSYTQYIMSCKRHLKPNRYIKYLFNSEVLKRYISSPADELPNLIQEFQSKFPRRNAYEWKEFQTYMIGQYDKIRHDYLHNILNSLNLSVCPYCNRHYIFTADNGKRVGAQFDHFYSKADYPYLALSFYNLIPCCPTCNKVKGDDPISINPYIEGFEDKCKIQIDSPINCILNNEPWNVIFKGQRAAMDNVKAFVLDELYKKHKDYASEIVFKEIANSKGYFDTIKQDFQSMGLSDDVINSIIWNTGSTTDGNPKRPLTKMTEDIIQQIESLKNTL